MMAKAASASASTSKLKVKPDQSGEVAIISTSDRNSFRSCRRKWNWQSHLRHGLSPVEQATPLWFGSGFHHAMEDYHGLQLYKTPQAAFDDYMQATLKHYKASGLPENVDELRGLAHSMLTYYTDFWLTDREPLETYKVHGVPQVEVPFEFEIPVNPELLSKTKYKKVVYKGIIDRVVVDEHGYLWLVDYKSVSSFNTTHLELDAQIGVYLWAASYIYRRPVVGFIYMQFRKSICEPPRILKNGTISSAKDQLTCHGMYRKALLEMYGTPKNFPDSNVEMLNYLVGNELEESDKFIRRDRVDRSRASMENEAAKILAEVEDMLDPALKIYPNPSFMCPSMCSFINPCLEYDRGENYIGTLETDYFPRDYSERNDWRRFLRVGRKEDKPVIQAKAERGKIEDFRKAAKSGKLR